MHLRKLRKAHLHHTVLLWLVHMSGAAGSRVAMGYDKYATATDHWEFRDGCHEILTCMRVIMRLSLTKFSAHSSIADLTELTPSPIL